MKLIYSFLFFLLLASVSLAQTKVGGYVYDQNNEPVVEDQQVTEESQSTNDLAFIDSRNHIDPDSVYQTRPYDPVLFYPGIYRV